MKWRKPDKSQEIEIEHVNEVPVELPVKKRSLIKQLSLLFFLAGILLALFLIGAKVYNRIYYENPIHYYFSSDIIKLYEKYDRNSDGSIDLNEFEPIGHQILSNKKRLIVQNQAAIDDEEFITLNAFYEPVVSDALSNKSYFPVKLLYNLIIILS